MVGKATPDRGGPQEPRWNPDAVKKASIQQWTLGLRLSSPREQERHNVTVITVGSKYYSLCLVSSTLSHANPEQPFCTLTNKVRGKYICKDVFLCLSACVCLCHSVLIIVSLWCCRWAYNCIVSEHDWLLTPWYSVRSVFSGCHELPAYLLGIIAYQPNHWAIYSTHQSTGRQCPSISSARLGVLWRWRGFGFLKASFVVWPLHTGQCKVCIVLWRWGVD